jgi:uncharacterized protein (TIGR02594 family)
MKYDILKNPGTRAILHLSKDIEERKNIQRALNNMGKHLIVDGDIGPVTLHTIKTVNNRRLHEEILNIMFPGSNKLYKKPKWIKIAYKEIGTKEYKGKASNKAVERYHSVAGYPNWSDDVPWCASFVSFVMVKAGYTELPKYPARAKSWLNFGKRLINPVYGSIAVKSRHGGGHVTFVVGQSSDGNILYCLGGNQNDAVNIKRYRKSDFIAFVVPKDYDFSMRNIPIMNKKGKIVSVKES